MYLFIILGSVLATVSGQVGLCPAPNGDYPNPSSEQCTTFFRCTSSNPTLLRCPANQRFDFLFRICRPQRSVNCNNQLQVFAAPAASGGGFSGLGALGGLGGLTGGLGGLGGLAGGLGGLGGLPGGLGGLGALAGGPGTLAGGLGGLTGGLGGLTGGLGGLGALGGLGGGQLGAGLPDGGFVTLLSQLGGSDGDGQNGSNSLATVLLMSALMNQRNTATQAPPVVGPIPFFSPASEQFNSQQWQQPLGGYSPEGAGPVITVAADSRNFVLLPQAEGQQRSSQYPHQGQNSILFNRGINQPQLQNMVVLPLDKEDNGDDLEPQGYTNGSLTDNSTQSSTDKSIQLLSTSNIMTDRLDGSVFDPQSVSTITTNMMPLPADDGSSAAGTPNTTNSTNPSNSTNIIDSDSEDLNVPGATNQTSIFNN